MTRDELIDSLAERTRLNRYDLVEVSNSSVVPSSRFDVTRYDSLDLSKSTAFQRFRRRRKYRERKSPNGNTFWGMLKIVSFWGMLKIVSFWGMLKIVFRNIKEFMYWVKTGETPGVRS